MRHLLPHRVAIAALTLTLLGIPAHAAVSPSNLPEITGRCPNIDEGVLKFRPSGLFFSRKAEIWLSDEAFRRNGPVVFYWHGRTEDTDVAEDGITEAAFNDILDQGGVIVSPHHSPFNFILPWYLNFSRMETDLKLADEILACLIDQVGIDTRRIYTMGMSAGAMHAAQMAYRRSNYIAAGATYSGGFVMEMGVPEMQMEENPLPMLIFFGGEDDREVVGFEQASYRLYNDLRERGHAAYICEHDRGHRMPPRQDRRNVWRFFDAHPFGTTDSPWEGNLPSFESECR